MSSASLSFFRCTTPITLLEIRNPLNLGSGQSPVSRRLLPQISCKLLPCCSTAAATMLNLAGDGAQFVRSRCSISSGILIYCLFIIQQSLITETAEIIHRFSLLDLLIKSLMQHRACHIGSYSMVYQNTHTDVRHIAFPISAYSLIYDPSSALHY